MKENNKQDSKANSSDSVENNRKDEKKKIKENKRRKKEDETTDKSDKREEKGLKFNSVLWYDVLSKRFINEILARITVNRRTYFKRTVQ